MDWDVGGASGGGLLLWRGVRPKRPRLWSACAPAEEQLPPLPFLLQQKACSWIFPPLLGLFRQSSLWWQPSCLLGNLGLCERTRHCHCGVRHDGSDVDKISSFLHCRSLSAGFSHDVSGSDASTRTLDPGAQARGFVRKDGLLGLEDYQTDNAFYEKTINPYVDGTLGVCGDGDDAGNRPVDVALHDAAMIVQGIGDSAPALGMLGTLVGLVQMLNNMEDPSAIGPAMAVALLTTFYGAFIAQLVSLPLADKLKMKSEEEHRNMTPHPGQFSGHNAGTESSFVG